MDRVLNHTNRVPRRNRIDGSLDPITAEWNWNTKGRSMTDHQRRVLEHMTVNGAGRVSASVFADLCRSPQVVRAMFRHGFVAGDSIPAVYVNVTDTGLAALAKRK